MRYIIKKIPILIFLLLPLVAYAQSANYIIRGRDVLRVMVYDHPDLNTVVRVAETGTITFPLLGEVEVKGLTVRQVERKIADLLSKGIIVNPQVSVFVEQFKNKRVAVIGEVNRPGRYELIMDEPTYVADIISNCLGLTRDAGETLTILRKVEGKQRNIIVELSRLLKDGDLSQNVELLDGDLLYVPRAGYFYIYGQVNRPGYYRIEPGLTVIKAISMAGGPTVIASTRGIRIIRKTKDVETTIRVELNNPIQPGDEFFEDGDMSQDIKLQDGDVLYLPRAAYFYVYGEVNRPGYYKMEPGLTVIKAITIAGGVTDKASTRRIKVIRKTENKKIIAKSDLQNKKLVRKLLEEKIIKDHGINSDYAYFSEIIKNEAQLKERLEQTGISKLGIGPPVKYRGMTKGGANRKKPVSNSKLMEKVLALWRQPRKEITFQVGLDYPIEGEDVITVPESIF